MFDWDEVNFAECAREMIVSKNYSEVQLNYRPFWEKPPLFIWFEAACMKAFGVNEFSARLPNVICAFFTMLTLFNIGKKVYSNKFGLLWAATFSAMLLPHLYFKSGLIDPWFNLFILLSIYYSINYLSNSGFAKVKWALLSALFIGFAVLTKGPVALLILGSSVFITILFAKEVKQIISFHFLFYVLVIALISSTWFLMLYFTGNSHIITEFLNYQIRLLKTGDAGHEGPIFYHVFVLLIGCFPFSLLFIEGIKKKIQNNDFQKKTNIIMLASFFIVLIVFSIVKTKIVHYSSFCYFGLSFFSTQFLVNYAKEKTISSNYKLGYILISLVMTLVLLAVSCLNYIKPYLLNLNIINDEIAVELLKTDVNNSLFEIITVVLFITSSVLFYRVLFYKKTKMLYVSIATFILFLFTSILFFVPKAEMFVQNSAIQFYKSVSDKKCYIETKGFKSYAYLFYSNRQPSDYTNAEQIKYINAFFKDPAHKIFTIDTFYGGAICDWMSWGKIDKPAYVVCRTIDEKQLFTNLEMRKLYSKNGFSFFVRMPK